MNRVLLDQGLAPNAAALLRLNGWDAIHVIEVDLSRACDEEILLFARQDRRTCVTLDHDFHAHLALAGSQGPSVILLCVEGLNAVQQADLIRRVWEMCAEELTLGVAVSADLHAVRLRRLPLR